MLSKMKHEKFTVTQDHLNHLYTLHNVNEARQYALDLVNKSHSKSTKKVRLQQSLARASSNTQVTEIVLNFVLSGEGHSSLLSNWNSRA